LISIVPPCGSPLALVAATATLGTRKRPVRVLSQRHAGLVRASSTTRSSRSLRHLLDLRRCCVRPLPSAALSRLATLVFPRSPHCTPKTTMRSSPPRSHGTVAPGLPTPTRCRHRAVPALAHSYSVDGTHCRGGRCFQRTLVGNVCMRTPHHCRPLAAAVKRLRHTRVFFTLSCAGISSAMRDCITGADPFSKPSCSVVQMPLSSSSSLWDARLSHSTDYVHAAALPTLVTIAPSLACPARECFAPSICVWSGLANTLTYGAVDHPCRIVAHTRAHTVYFHTVDLTRELGRHVTS
jgi:hypothetical protein